MQEEILKSQIEEAKLREQRAEEAVRLAELDRRIAEFERLQDEKIAREAAELAE